MLPCCEYCLTDKMSLPINCILTDVFMQTLTFVVVAYYLIFGYLVELEHNFSVDILFT